jgi:hypothetical protein
MNYHTARSLAQDGDIFFLGGTGTWAQRIISLVTTSEYVHCGIVFWYQGRLLIAESNTGGGTRVVSASTYADRKVQIIQSGLNWADVANDSLANMGLVGYGYVSNVYIGIRELTLKYFNLQMPPLVEREMACSEWVARVLQLSDTNISPGKLYQELTRE